MSKQVPVSNDARADLGERDSLHLVLSDLAYQRLGIVNVIFVGSPQTPWVLVDAGLAGTGGFILRAAKQQHGDRPASAIVLTHGHFDHVGAVRTLAQEWNVPVYAHELEHPYLDGRSSYPPPDPDVGGGVMAAMASLYPRGPIDIRNWLKPLPVDHSVPGMPEWTWIHTPGHSPGHISLWRESDRTLIAGDAFITTRQESAYAVATQQPEIHGPPMYYTTDWVQAAESVRTLAALKPDRVVTGHGRALQGPEMLAALQTLADRFEEIAVPTQGRYVAEPARADLRGTVYVPPKSGVQTAGDTRG